ncbi:hypothetical protein V6N00_13245 [Tersicoccus sp. MR15.9]|uniref:hypothetical protein n=1 Tax=Tersicoccus mangrovi TaxID=3121635 RepID=UPI002FE6422B
MSTSLPSRHLKGAADSTGGQFRTTAHGEPSLSLSPVPARPHAHREPQDIDVELAGLYSELSTAKQRVAGAARGLHYTAGDSKTGPYGRGPWKMTDQEAYDVVAAKNPEHADLAFYDERVAKVEEIAAVIEPLNVEYAARPWPRAFLATSSDGHVHSSMRCPTCNRGESATQFQWMTDYSDQSEEDIVAAAGYRACTTCYPSAPIGDKHTLPTKMLSHDEVSKEAARREREAKAVEKAHAKAAKAIAGPDGGPLVLIAPHPNGWNETESFTTEASAVQWLVGEHVDNARHAQRGDHQYVADVEEAQRLLVDALVAKHGTSREEQEEIIAKKVAAKKKREGVA